MRHGVCGFDDGANYSLGVVSKLLPRSSLPHHQNHTSVEMLYTYSETYPKNFFNKSTN